MEGVKDSKAAGLQGSWTLTLEKTLSWKIEMHGAEKLHKSMNSENEMDGFCESGDSGYLTFHDGSGEISSEQVFLQKMPTRMFSPKTKRNYENGKRYSCPICAESFSTSPVLLGHMLSHTGEKPHVCNFCGCGYARQSDLEAHMKVHANENFTSDVRGKTFASGNELNKHACNLNGSALICSKCGKRFHDQAGLQRHLLFHREKKPSGSFHREMQRYLCELCDKSFTQSSTLKIHKRTHTGEKPFVCSICGSSFIRRDTLNHHIRTHSGEKPYSCTICGKTFTQPYSLTVHKRSHMGEKHNMCDICGKQFSRAYHLRRHRDIHSGEKPHACETCGKTFSQISGLRMHAATHSGEKPHICAVCNKGFARAWHLKRHYEIHERWRKGSES